MGPTLHSPPFRPSHPDYGQHEEPVEARASCAHCAPSSRHHHPHTPHRAAATDLHVPVPRRRRPQESPGGRGGERGSGGWQRGPKHERQLLPRPSISTEDIPRRTGGRTRRSRGSTCCYDRGRYESYHRGRQIDKAGRGRCSTILSSPHDSILIENGPKQEARLGCGTVNTVRRKCILLCVIIILAPPIISERRRVKELQLRNEGEK